LERLYTLMVMFLVVVGVFYIVMDVQWSLLPHTNLQALKTHKRTLLALKPLNRWPKLPR